MSTIWAFRKPGPDVYPQGYVMFDGHKQHVRIEFRQEADGYYQVMTLDRRSARLLARRIDAALASKRTPSRPVENQRSDP